MLAAVVGFLISHLVNHVTSHGRLIEPPSRASMWRYGFNTPPNYNDHELYCGGFTKQWQVNGGKCGICGDPWEAQPRPHEAGGKYATGTIVRKYRAGSTFTIRVELTANHRGYFEFRLCPNNNVKLAANQECLDHYVLKRGRMSTREVDDQYHETRFYPGTENKVYEMKYKLPSELTCTQCVLQWKYIAGNNWGMCPNGTGAVGCGHQEEFRACADIQISDTKGDADDTPFTTLKPVPTRRPTTSRPTSTTEYDATTPDESENEIPDQDEDISKEYFAMDYIMVAMVTVLLAFAFVAIIFFGIYVYYYHVDRSLGKTKDMNVCFSMKQIAETLWDKTKQKFKGDKLGQGHVKESSVDKNGNMEGNAPVPPPRIKKNTTIGFKGVPDNLI
uniref:Chitin-binding type-4 domain-containing protein n=1 Tax=Cacopsylla melanoneura TaxID=428564 RepID=A0A8D8SYJ5_9HEMI